MACSPTVRPLEPLATWMECHKSLPSGLSATAGPVTLHPFQRAIVEAVADPKMERLSVLKSARIGFATIVVGAIAHFIVRGRALVAIRPRDNVEVHVIEFERLREAASDGVIKLKPDWHSVNSG